MSSICQETGFEKITWRLNALRTMNVKYKDYYKILGVSRDASPEEIHKQYRKQARTYHPDVNKSSGAEDRFKEIQEAHEVLKDPEKRKHYDALGTNWHSGQDFRPHGWEGMFTGRNRNSGHAGFDDFGQSEFSNFFEILFGDLSGFGGFGGHGRVDSHRTGSRQMEADHPDHLETDIELSLEEVFQGGKRRISIRYPEGAGMATRTIDVKIPRGLKEGSKIRVPGQGVTAVKGGKPGDLMLKVRFLPHKYFKADGFDLHIQAPLSPWEAALGSKVNIPTLDGSVKVTIKPGTRSGHRLKVQGKGLRRGDNSRGDLVVELKIVVSPSLTPEEEALYQKLAELGSFKPRTWER